MGREIERKFLVRDPSVVDGLTGTPVRQGYLSLDPARTVRVRRAGERAYVTIKGPSRGAVRAEYEFAVDPGDADEMLDALALRPLVEKTRYELVEDGRCWEIDVFAGDNAGLVVAELELSSEQDAEAALTPPSAEAAPAPLKRPPWLGREVTGDARYYNASLVTRPFRSWTEEERAAAT